MLANDKKPLSHVMQALYLVLVTNKKSNILEDLETLRMLGKVVADLVMPLEEEYIAAAAFDLIFAFDEVVGIGGHKENITAGQVRQNTEMESHEEKLHKMIIQSKINETKDIMKKKAMEIERSKLESMRGGPGRPSVPAGMTSYGSGGVGGTGPSLARADLASGVPSIGRTAASGAAGGTSSAASVRKGMQLGKGKLGRRDILESLKAEGEVLEDISSGAAAAAAPHPPPSEPVFITVEEKVTVALNKDGGLEGMEVTGAMSLTVAPDIDACVRVQLSGEPLPGYQFKTHPNIDKALFGESNALGLKDPARSFPSGAPLGVLKWRYQTVEESQVPITINCWPSVSGGQSYVNIEYESNAQFDLQDVQIAVPLPALGAAPVVNSCDGDWKFDARKSAWIWTIELIDKDNSEGSAEFIVPATDASAFFPITVSFKAPRTLCDIKVEGVFGAQDGQPVKYGTSTSLITDSYTIE